MSDLRHRIKEALRKHPYRNLFFVLLVFFALDAIDLPEPTQGLFSNLCFAFVLFTALFETLRTRRHAIIAAVLGLPAVFSRIIIAFLPDNSLGRSVVLALSIFFMMFLIWNLLNDLLKGKRATGERVFGALSAYLFIGILFALLYAHLHSNDPGCFSFPDHMTQESPSNKGFMLTTFMYFSFVTLTTLGYGDITPITDHARTLAYVEALIGQLFLAVMVAGLVGVSFAEAAQRKAENDANGEAPENPMKKPDHHGGPQR